MDTAHIRNFCIIAHIDHGKTTLSDRLLELTGTVEKREMREQVLDSMDLERERGITIKAHPVTMRYRARSGEEYRLNLIDTPGHVDFAYEVSRSLAACEGAVLVVDAAQGVEAQTVANVQMAMRQGLVIVPVINKIDLPSANVEDTRRQIEEMLALPGESVLHASAKTGVGVREILEAVLERVPPPRSSEETLRALVFDSVFDTYRGVVTYVRVFDGEIVPGMLVQLMSTGQSYEVKEVGVFSPKPVRQERLGVGEVGYVIANIKTTGEVRIGDTMTDARKPAGAPLPGFQRVRPMVFSGLYPIDSADYEALKAALGKLHLNDAAFEYQAESSAALGFGFRCGFLGLLHMEIVMERLRRQWGMNIIATYPSVIYRVLKTDGSVVEVDNPLYLPDPSQIEAIEEPYVRAHIICPNENIGDMLGLVMEKRGTVTKTDSVDTRRVMLTADLPLNEILVDFHDKIKSITRGYGSMEYEPCGYREGDLVKLDILVNGEPVDAFSCIVHRSKAEARGRALAQKLKEVIPQQLFQVAIQAAIGSRIIARETVRALAKNVTAKCYGGDITRKRKLWEKQKEGKKRMKAIGKVNIPQEAFITVLRTG
ncbi:MAG: translation elongation factor 4 [Verrucomicrobiae bacterium]|nr:translation elongation factor 4 [Verrucomicrobiae bacterium]MDW8343941.1 translation elongation factor 4 [Verrucomicrobiae bacterium]